MKGKVIGILSSVVSVILVDWILDSFGWRQGIIILGLISLTLWVIATELEKIAKVIRAVTERLTNEK
ncbi:MAG: hypothetical protein K2G70_02400 [Turicibacter sp.]|nr:hypothetical protein [Turicibacter sp.]